MKKKREYLSGISSYLLQSNILSIANVLRNVEKIYFPIRLDIRGRLNCVAHSLFNYQGNELAKSLFAVAPENRSKK